MLTRNLVLDTIDKVKNFNDIMRTFEHAADITSGRYVVNAHSIMGLLSLDLTKPVTLVVHDDECHEVTKDDVADFLQDIATYIVE